MVFSLEAAARKGRRKRKARALEAKSMGLRLNIEPSDRAGFKSLGVHQFSIYV
jgi:hypothetical protein